MTASTSSTQYMVTKNTKFEAKLARYLISNPGDQLLGYDACIEKLGKSIQYRLIVLGLESIYLPDNPPKIAQLKEPFIYYCDILRAEMIDDYPDFLFGNERLNTLHMRLRVMMPSNKKKKRKKKKPQSVSVDDMETIPSLFDRLTLENINNYMDQMTPRRATSNRDLYQAPLPQLYAAIPLLLSTPTTTTATATDETDPLHLNLQQLDDFTSTTVSNTSREFKERLDQLNLNTDRSNFQRLFSTRRTMSEDQRTTARSTSARASSKKKTSTDSDWITDTPRLNRYALQKHDDDRYGVLHTPRNSKRENNDDDVFLSTARSTLTDLSLTNTSSINASNNYDSSVYCPSVEEVRSLRDDDDDQDMKDIDIYFLSLNSKIPEILSAALSNYIVVSTLRYNKNPQLSTLLSTADSLQHSMDTTLMKFSDLKAEILQSLTDSSETIKLTEELYNSCEKYSKIKELFWKDPDLFIFYVAKFHTCSQAIANNKLDSLTISFSFSIMQLLNQVFLNTFASNERFTRLTNDECSRFKMLANCLLVPPISLLSTQTTSDESNGTLQDTYKLVLQWMFASSAILWQIGDLLMRPSWTSENFRFKHFIELFEKQPQKDEYFDLFIDALSRLTMNNENKDPLSPKHALYVYQLFSILSMLLINSPTISEYLSDRYIEDFKYFLKEDVILSRIPVEYPIYRFIPELVRGVHHRILYGEPNTHSTNRVKHRQLI